ncbi:MAG TPA: sigma 54-interacting transcriptional regulator [Polyangia bacterium]|nr:sigma 54-interacting transcriptional regulator [Polyangia bacterium]
MMHEWTDPHSVNWDDIRELHAIKKLAQIINRRWNLGLGFVSGDGSHVTAPQQNEHATVRAMCQLIQSKPAGLACCERTGAEAAQGLSANGKERHAIQYSCHAGLREVAVPVVIEGLYVGTVLAGGFLPSEGNGEPAIPARVAHLALPAADQQVALARQPRLAQSDVAYLIELMELVAEEIVAFQTEVMRKERRLDQMQKDLLLRYSYEQIVGRSRPMQELYRLLDKIIDSDSTVLIQGENGTGKELIAKAIHYNSLRKHKRFVAQNCSAFNDNLLDSELFGHKKGAFTGAVSDKQGLFEVADGGTFFLDEIGDMSPSLQVKLLRVLQEGTFIPVGGTEVRRVDVRVIAATNRDLKRMVERAEFREDLYYRVNVINLTIPPLRDRKEDIPALVDHFLKKYAKGRRLKMKKLTKGCLDRMMEYNWPGNIRELENEIERLVVLAGDDKVIAEEMLSARIRQQVIRDEIAGLHEPNSLPDAVSALERNMIYEVLKKTHWNKTKAAHELRISRRNLIRKVSKYKLDQRKARG